MESKPCRRCSSTERYADGRCKACSNARQAKYRANNAAALRAKKIAYAAANREKERQRAAAWLTANRERKLAADAAYRKSHQNELREYKARWSVENSAHVVAKVAKWRAANPGMHDANNARRRALKLRATPAWADLDAIRAIYAEAKRLQQKTGCKMHVDHIVPLVSKIVCGLHVPWNLQVLPDKDNHRKSNKRWPDMPD